MKKLMIGLAAAGLCGAVFADVTSANIVGYNTQTTDGQKSPLFGLCFTPVGKEKNVLGDFKPVDGSMTADDDCIQVINPTTLGTDALITYCDKTTADLIAEDEQEEPGTFDYMIGWWDEYIGVGEDGANMDDYEVTPGFGFMGFFMNENANLLQFTSAGEAPTVATSYTTDGQKSPIIVNYIPRDFKLKYFTPVDGTFTADDDCIQVINPTSLGTDALITYCDKTTADLIAEDEQEEPGTFDYMIGWWDEYIGVGEDGASMDDYNVPAGFGFMGFFMNEDSNEITFQLPSSTATLD